MNNIIQASVQGFGITPKPVTYNYDSLLILLVVMVAAPVMVWGGYALYQAWIKNQSISREWREIQAICRKQALTREESFLIKQSLKQCPIKHPAEIVKNENVFDLVIRKTLQRATGHKDHLVQSIRQKLYG